MSSPERVERYACLLPAGARRGVSLPVPFMHTIIGAPGRRLEKKKQVFENDKQIQRLAWLFRWRGLRGGRARRTLGGGFVQIGQRLAQAAGGFTMNLANTAFRHTQHASDLFQIQVLDVVKR